MTKREVEFISILRAFAESGAVRHLVLVGSWALYIYRKHYPLKQFYLVTSDIDFSIDRPHDGRKSSIPKISETLDKLGYEPVVNALDNSEKYVPRADVPGKELMLEFLCAPGRHAKNAFPIRGLGITAMPIRFQQVLVNNVETLEFEEIAVTVTSPAFWAAHKIAISQVRAGTNKAEKSAKDLWGADVVVRALGDEAIVDAASRVGGKFAKLFDRGWESLKKQQNKSDL